MSVTKEQVIETRTAAGKTMDEIAAIMGVTRMTVHNWEKGIHPMKPQAFEYLKYKLAE